MTKEEAKKRIKKLRDLIDYYRYAYHVLDKSEISDEAHDSLKNELFDLENQYPDLITPDSPTQKIGGEPLKVFKKVDHKQLMVSFFDAFSRQDMDNWENRNKKLLTEEELKKVNYYCEPKLDGLAIELTYEKEVLKIGATRGDGRVGEDVTQNIKTIESIPLRVRSKEEVLQELKAGGLLHIVETIKSKGLDHLIIRGEAIITKKEFEKTNKERVKKGLSIYANPRNLAAGSIRQLDSKITQERHLDADFYSLITDLGQKTHEEEHKILHALGMKTNNKYNKLCKDMNEVFEYYDHWHKNREKLPYEIDGTVVSINDNKIFKELGIVGKGPRGAIALKFPLKQSTTIVDDIKVQIGRTGAVTPVAILKPVEVNGAIVSRATLHNEKEIQRLGLKIGDTVIVGRAGDVIPEVLKAFPELRTGKEKDFKMPLKCPSCDTKLVKPENEVVWRCPNPNCFSRRLAEFGHFVSKGAFDIEGVGPKIIEKFIDEGLISDPADLFELKEGDMLPLERFADKSAKKIVQSIQKRKEIPFARFLYALGIRNTGEKTSQDLARAFRSLDKIKKASIDDLRNISDIGPVVAKSIYVWFNNKDNLKLLDKLENNGVKYYSERIINKLNNSKFVITGTLKTMSREQAKETIVRLGGQTADAVSKNIDYVVVGENPGSKYDKAKKLGVKVLTEEEFLRMIK